MIWVTWRQHRTESFILLGVLVLSSIFLLVTGPERCSPSAVRSDRRF